MVTKNFRKIAGYLENERNRLIQELVSCKEFESSKIVELSLISEREEVATQRSELELEFAKQRRIEAHIVEIERAKNKIQIGSYGLCDGCGLQIPIARLEAIPHTSLCLNCKGKQQVRH
jgi:DnaK suppressor protein